MAYKECASYRCKVLYDSVKRKANASGRSEYCSMSCYSFWSPAMRRASGNVGVKSREDLFRRAYNLKKKLGTTKASGVLGVSNSTLNRWSKLCDSEDT